MSLVVVVFLVEELILYVELARDDWIACGNTVGYTAFEGFRVVLVGCVLFVETPLNSVLEDRLKFSPWIFSLLFFGNNSVHRIIILVWMTGLYAGNCCGFDHMFSLLKRCKYSLYSDTMLNYWSTNHRLECIF